MTARWCSTVDSSTSDEPESGSLGSPIKCSQCNRAYLPTRERLRQILDGALQSLNEAKLSDALKGTVSDETIVELAAMAHALLYALSALERCEPCIRLEVARASELIVGRLRK
jgi:hypothetical protein